MLTLENVSKRFGDIVAVDGLSLSVNEGEIFGFLGPNGAGKSTSVNLAVGLLEPDSGSVAIGEHGRPRDPAVRARIGVATQAVAIYEELTGDENLRFFAKLYGLSGSELAHRVDWALAFVELTDRRSDPVSTYSGGMKRRINLAAALLHDPQLLLLDEPTVGVDPQSRNALHDKVAELKTQGRTVVYTSHYMEEVERICDRVGIIDEGKLLALGTVADLIAEHAGASVVIAETAAGERRLESREPKRALEALQGIEGLIGFRTERPDLETVFLNLTGHRLRD